MGPAATLPTQHLIVIPDNVEDAYVLETLSHGEDHVLLHHDRAGSDCRGTREVEGEFVDMVTAAHGLDSSQWTFKLWPGESPATEDHDLAPVGSPGCPRGSAEPR